MTLKTTAIKLVGKELLGAFDGKEYYIAIPELEDYLGERRNSTREKLTSKSMKAFLGKEIRLGKKNVAQGQKRYVTFMKVSDLSQYTVWLAINGNIEAQALLKANNEEAIERRIDSALGVDRSETERDERATAVYEYYRYHARVNFRPLFTDWLKKDDPSRKDYGYQVNLLKQAMGIGPIPVDEIAYDTTRKAGRGHYEALELIRA